MKASNTSKPKAAPAPKEEPAGAKPQSDVNPPKESSNTPAKPAPQQQASGSHRGPVLMSSAKSNTTVKSSTVSKSDVKGGNQNVSAKTSASEKASVTTKKTN